MPPGRVGSVIHDQQEGPERGKINFSVMTPVAGRPRNGTTTPAGTRPTSPARDRPASGAVHGDEDTATTDGRMGQLSDDVGTGRNAEFEPLSRLARQAPIMHIMSTHRD
jgi:hypothetical protein